jgi:hypothetical protein
MACFSAGIDRTSRPSSPWSRDLPLGATMNAEIVVIRRLAADLGTRHVHPHSSQVLA